MTARVGLLGTLLLLVLPGIAAAQERSCRQVLPSDARRLMNARGQEIIYFMDPVRVLCTGGLLLEADSAVMNRQAASVQLVGNVVYRDSLRQLTADWANYLGDRDQLFARGSVVLENREDGAVVEGDELDYLRANDTRPISQMIVRGERPYAVIPPRADSGQAADSVGADSAEVDLAAAGTASADTTAATEVWADRMEFEGEEVFRGLGNVELARGEMTGAGDTAVFNQRTERMTLTGGSHVQTDRYRLEGQRIDAFMDGRELRTVTADRAARVESLDLTVDADRIHIGFVEGELSRMQAWNPLPDSSARALANAEGFRLRADSIDAQADSLGIQEVRAVGRAYGERDADSLAIAEVGSGTVTRDWIQGDTILGYFDQRRVDPVARVGEMSDPETSGRRPVAGADSTETVLERIVVIGGGSPALSLYRMRQEQSAGEPAINFMKAERITLFMDQGDVTRVEADGPLDGLYLSPVPPRTEEGGQGEGGGASGEGGGAAGRGR